MRFRLISVRLKNLMLAWAYLSFKVGDSIFEFNAFAFYSGKFFIVGLLQSRITHIHDFERLIELWYCICQLPILSRKLCNMSLLTLYSFDNPWDFFDPSTRSRSWTPRFFAICYVDRRGLALDKIRSQPKLVTVGIFTWLSTFILRWLFNLFGWWWLW